MPTPSQLYRLIEERLPTTLAHYVAEHKATTSWRAMAADLSHKTGITVNHETLRLWFADRITVEVKVS